LYLKVPDREERDVQQVVVDRPAQELLYATRLSRAEARAFQKHLEKHRTNPARALRGAVLFMLAREQEYDEFIGRIVIPDGRAGRRVKRRSEKRVA
jgi:hypothetical protein